MAHTACVQRLLQETRRGHPLDSETLRNLGISAAIASELVKTGWLVRLSRGAYLLTGDVPSRDGTVAFLRYRIQGLHVAGKTALSWQGVRHNVPFRERIVLWGQKPYAFPAWIGQHFFYSYQTTALFDDEFLYSYGLKSLPSGDPAVLVSIPERALLELASDVGKGQTMEEASNLMIGLRNIRPEILHELLNHCTRVKVVRLVRDLAADAGFSWSTNLQDHVDRLGKGKRWTSKGKDGKRLTLKP